MPRVDQKDIRKFIIYLNHIFCCCQWAMGDELNSSGRRLAPYVEVGLVSDANHVSSYNTPCPYYTNTDTAFSRPEPLATCLHRRLSPPYPNNVHSIQRTYVVLPRSAFTQITNQFSLQNLTVSCVPQKCEAEMRPLMVRHPTWCLLSIDS